MNLPTQCPICLNMEMQQTYIEGPSNVYWFYCDSDIREDQQLWHFALLIRDDKLIGVTYADRNRSLHVQIQLEANTTKINKITSLFHVDRICVIPSAIKMNYYNHTEVTEKLKLLATFL